MGLVRMKSVVKMIILTRGIALRLLGGGRRLRERKKVGVTTGGKLRVIFEDAFDQKFYCCVNIYVVLGRSLIPLISVCVQ